MLAELSTCFTGLCGAVPCEIWLWAALALFVCETCEHA